MKRYWMTREGEEKNEYFLSFHQTEEVCEIIAERLSGHLRREQT